MPVDQTARDLKPERSPAAALPLTLLGFGAVHLAVLAAFLLWQAPQVAGGYLRSLSTLVATHLFTLGFATPVAMGAIYQMVPVLLHSRASAPRWAWLQAGLHGAGAWMLIWGFWRWRHDWIATGGTLVLVGIVIFVALLAAGLRRAEREQMQSPAMAGAAGYLLLAVSWAVVLAFNLRHGFVGGGAGLVASHVALGVLGWLLLLSAGVSYRLVPMFAGSRPGPAWPRRVALPVLAGAPLLISLAAALGWLPLARALGLAEAAAALLYAGDLLGIIRRRRTGRLEFTTGYAAAAAVCLALAAVAAAAALIRPELLPPARPGRVIALAVLFGLGWQGTMIMGQLVRVVPFIIWLDRFRRRWVREKIPFLHEMVGGRLPWAALAGWLAGVGALAAGMWLSAGGSGLAAAAPAVLRAGAGLLLAGALLYTGLVLGAYRHLYHRPAPGQATDLDPSAYHLHEPQP